MQLLRRNGDRGLLKADSRRGTLVSWLRLALRQLMAGGLFGPGWSYVVQLDLTFCIGSNQQPYRHMGDQGDSQPFGDFCYGRLVQCSKCF